MSIEVKYRDFPVASAATNTSLAFVGHVKRFAVQLPDPSKFGAAAFTMAVRGAINESDASYQLFYHDPAAAAAKLCQASVAVSGTYTMPDVGPHNAIQITFSTACTGGTNIRLIYALDDG